MYTIERSYEINIGIQTHLSTHRTSEDDSFSNTKDKEHRKKRMKKKRPENEYHDERIMKEEKKNVFSLLFIQDTCMESNKLKKKTFRKMY